MLVGACLGFWSLTTGTILSRLLGLTQNICSYIIHKLSRTSRRNSAKVQCNMDVPENSCKLTSKMVDLVRGVNLS